jgi:hypothetical protein
MKHLEKMMGGGGASGPQRRPTPVLAPVASRAENPGAAAPTSRGVARKLESLPRIDLDVLRAIMVLKGEVVDELLKSPEMCEELQPETLRFVSVFSELLHEDPEDEERQRLATKELLQSLGPDWVGLWKEAYKMVKAGVSMRDLYQGCRVALRREKLKRLLEESKRELIEGGLSSDEQLEVSERIRALKTQMDSFARGVDL